MDAQKAASELIGDLSTKQEAEELIALLDSKSPLTTALSAKLARFDDSARRATFGKSLSRQELTHELKKILAQNNFPKLEIAFEPRYEFVKELKEYFSKNLNQIVLLDLVINPTIIGGAIIICNNHYRDFSLSSKITAHV